MPVVQSVMQRLKHRLMQVILDKSWLRFHPIQLASVMTRAHDKLRVSGNESVGPDIFVEPQ